MTAAAPATRWTAFAHAEPGRADAIDRAYLAHVDLDLISNVDGAETDEEMLEVVKLFRAELARWRRHAMIEEVELGGVK